MKKLAILLVFATLASLAQAQSTQTAIPQTARQALLEMFFSKTPGTLMKHLPAATLAALEKSGALASLQSYSLLASQFQTKETKEKSFETFETGSVLLTGTNSQSGEKFDVAVENDTLQGDEDNITLSFHSYKEKQLQRTPYMPSMTFAMKMESGIWKLNEILFTIRLPLADPDFLKKITEGMKSQTTTPMTVPSQPRVSVTSFNPDTTVVSALRTILTAEATYRTTYRAIGYTCTLSDLDGFGGGEPNEHQAMLIPSDLAGGRRYGYAFTLSGCNGSPANGFHLAATPAGSSFGRRTYCVDQSGTIRSSTDGNPATCLASGIPLP